MTSQERLALVVDLGVQVHHDYRHEGEPGKGRHRVELPDIVTGVHLPLSAEEWCQIAMREGDEYVGGCCGNTAAMQDHINAAFRDSGWIDSGDFLYVGTLAKDHDGFDCFGLDDADLARCAQHTTWDVLGAWDKLGVAYSAVEPLLKPDRKELPAPPRDDARTLAVGLGYMRWESLFADRPGEGLAQQHAADALLTRARILEPCRRVLAQLEAIDQRFEGFALIAKGTDEVLVNGAGPCVYADQAQAQYWLDLMNRHDAMEEEHEPMYQRPLKVQADIVPCTVTVAEGLRLVR